MFCVYNNNDKADEREKTPHNSPKRAPPWLEAVCDEGGDMHP